MWEGQRLSNQTSVVVTAYEVVRSAAVARDRGGNERAVKYSKLSGLIRKGLLPHEDPVTMCDVWLAWGFQCNFMYAPPL